MNHLVFVYGSLMTGLGNHSLLARASARGDARKVCDATTAGRATMRSVSGHYPAIVNTNAGPSTVRGEVWSVGDRCLGELDRLEGFPMLYDREPITVVDDETGDQIVALVYVWATTVAEDHAMPIVHDGDWRRHKHEHEASARRRVWEENSDATWEILIRRA